MSNVVNTAKAKRGITASQLSLFLIILLVTLLLALIGGSAFAASLLIKQSAAAAHAQIDADVSEGDTQRLEGLKQYLADNQSGIAQTQSLTANLGQYNQNTIAATISQYASKSGISITSYDFGTGTGTTAATPVTASSANTVNITLGSPVKYTNFVTFLRLLEHGLMPAQVISGTVTANAESPGTVVVSPLTVKVAG